ncbi:MAG TPA: amino acid adenylation domain-containing protein [Tahibacter sp.]|nr:amino acid adenylation domain-containing protein [Tahibacter sp.]
MAKRNLRDESTDTPAAGLSFAQERLWIVDKLVDDKALYNASMLFSLAGALDAEAFRRALAAVVRRHAVLRTGFAAADGRLLVADEVDFEHVCVDAAAFDSPGSLRAHRHAVACAPFDLERPPLLRSTLYRHDGQHHEWLLTVHHIIFDGASIDVMLQELAPFYAAERTGAPPQLPDLDQQASDVAAAERRRFDADTKRRLLDAAKTLLGDELPVLALPSDRARPPVQGFSGATLKRAVPRPLQQALEAVCRAERVTPFMLVCAVYAIWLCRHASQSEVMIGSPFALRADKAAKGLIGFFVNTVAMRVKVEPGIAFRQLLRTTRDLCLKTYPLGELPFAELVNALDANRDLGHAPVFQAMLAVQNRRPPVALSPDLRMSYLGELPIDKARFDVSLVLDFLPDGAELSLEYSTELFDPATADSMLDRFFVLLDAALAEPEQTVDRLALLPDHERERLQAWSQRPVAEVPDCTVHALFERAAAAAPERVAVAHRDATLTFRALDEQAEALAGFLHAQGVRNGDLVGVCLPRSPDALIAVLAVWKAGAAYVPLDPEQPAPRHAFIAQDAGFRCVLTQASHRERFAAPERIVWCLDDAGLRERIAASAVRAPRATDAAAPAYVIYTSGSTGEPKGVLVEHRAVSRLLGSSEPLGYPPGIVMLQSVNAAFDASVLETWGPLCRGGRLALYPGPSPDVSALLGLIAQHRVNTLTLPATLLDMWVEQLEGPTGLERIVAGGEALSPATVKRLYALDECVVVINHYGPTENGILSTYYPVPRDVPMPIPIGRAAPGTRLFVLNDAQQLQPAGAVGELYLAGQGLARGYLGRAPLTAEKFLPAPAQAGSAHWYRTGDLVRWQATGSDDQAVLQFVGRSDQQVKIRGFRIELGEIEARLRACAGVQDAKAVVRRAPSGDRQIVGYVIAVGGTDERPAWRARLQRELPAYMMPSALVLLSSWPLTPNGKLDANALPAPDRHDYTQAAFAAAATDTERTLLGIWCGLLRLDRISIDDGFFELGGHSLLATKLHNRIRAELAVDIPLRTLFEAQTIRELAARLDIARNDSGPDRSADGTSSQWPPVRALPATDHAPLSYSQQRLWFIHHLDTGSAQYHIPYRLRLQGALDTAALQRALRDLSQRHDVLRTTFREIDGEPRQIVQPDGGIELVVHDLNALAEPQRSDTARQRLHDEARRPFDLSREIPWRACLAKLSADEHWLALTVHHIAADGWSMSILERELASLYAMHRDGATSPLPALPVRYADYAQWQRTHLHEAALEPQLAYWEQRLAGIPLLHNLALDRPRPAIQQYRGGVVRQRLPRELVQEWQRLVQRHEATLFMGLQAAFAVLLARYSGETDIVIGTPVANRRDESLTPLMGLFINTLVLRSDLSGDPTFVELLARSRDDALDAYENQDVPFELLVERLNPPRHAAYGPLFQVLFALQNTDMALPALPGLDVSAIPLAERYAKFDLALNLQHEGDALLAEWEYDAELFDADTVEQMAASYRVLLGAILAAPQTKTSRLALLDAASRERMLALGNDTARSYDERDCLHTLIERQAAQTPDAIAVRHGEVQLTYAQLDREADRLAGHLRALGVKPDTRVAIAMDRDPRLVVALLATLKAGGAYVPLDASYPEARLAAMLEDSDPVVALTLGEAGERIRGAAASAVSLRLPIVDLRSDASAWSEPAQTAPGSAEVGAGSRDVAYVIYTSGSTGRPKGVMNEHGAIVNRLRWMQESYPLAAHDTFLQTATIGFGASVVEIFWPLIAGAQLLLAEGDGHKNPAYLADAIRREGVTALHFVPSMLQAFLDHPQARDCRSLARIFCGGEPMPGHLARRCREQLPHTRLYHLYGSSETAVLSTGWDCSREAIPDNVPIGLPGANTRVYLLDAHGEPVPRGVRGEIHVAGRQVARGYLNDAATNAQRFLADPFHPGNGERMYRSGDLGRRRADGAIEHLGRNDFQIKIRGQRVELGDIEAQLLAHPDVRQAVVFAHDDGDGSLRLVGYVVPAQETASAATLVAALRTHLQAQLPAHMVPAAFVALPQFPLNANGKLDRQALPAPGVQPTSAAPVVPPETDLQRQLVPLWQDLLKQQPIGIACDFFAAGGHSLLVLRLANQLRDIFGYELDMKAFFASPTIAALAEDIRRHEQLQRAARRFQEADAAEIVEF